MQTATLTATVYEFNRYSATEDGDVSAEPVEIVTKPCLTEGAARAEARSMARKHQGPVDLALAGDEPWSERYVGTAVPAWPYTECKTTVFERLD